MNGEQPKKKNLRWIVLFGFTAVVDLAQFLIDLTGIGIAVSEIIEIGMPFALIGLLLVFKIPIFSHPSRMFSILGVDLGDALTGGIAPLWVADVWYLYRSVRKEEKAAEEAAAQQQDMNMPLYAEGRREPAGPATRPLNEDGIRRPTPPPTSSVEGTSSIRKRLDTETFEQSRESFVGEGYSDEEAERLAADALATLRGDVPSPARKPGGSDLLAA